MQESDHSGGTAEYNRDLSMIVNCQQLLRREIIPVPASDHEVDKTVVMNTQTTMEHNVQRFQVPI